ncbi:nuclear transport factor 2 family protein [Cupriavidus numazuensis]|uniref:nuclear transport factor 2 family protein n=1 Tax=Cupriavidus numazuensis TaxID=221992 RepID=UPI001BA64744|nr:nuclear transport factor 2 family protein [Cupriavidus numazuensis]
MPHNQHAVQTVQLTALLTWYDTLSPTSLESIAHHYARGARFRDPFNDVYGITAIRAIFEHMFETVEHPHFAISTQMTGGAEAFIAWTFTGKVRQHAFSVPGCTHLRFDQHGSVADHHDFWDAATLWRQLPLIHTPVSWLCKRFSATHA